MTEAAGACAFCACVRAFVWLSLSGGDELGGFNFAASDSDGPGGCHGNLPDQVRESLVLVINHPGCHGRLGPGRHGAICNWRWIDAAMLSQQRAERKVCSIKRLLKLAPVTQRHTHSHKRAHTHTHYLW